MDTTKEKKALAKKAAEKVAYSEKDALAIARRNGNALRVSTAKNSGEYTISPTAKTGTPTVFRKIFADYFPKVKAVSGADFVSAIDTILSEPSGIADLSKAVSKEIGREYGNAKTLLRRIRGNIREGSILRFKLLD